MVDASSVSIISGTMVLQQRGKRSSMRQNRDKLEKKDSNCCQYRVMRRSWKRNTVDMRTFFRG
jgi:hypothetical protein